MSPLSGFEVLCPVCPVPLKENRTDRTKPDNPNVRKCPKTGQNRTIGQNRTKPDKSSCQQKKPRRSEAFLFLCLTATPGRTRHQLALLGRAAPGHTTTAKHHPYAHCSTDTNLTGTCRSLTASTCLALPCHDTHQPDVLGHDSLT